MNKLFRSSTDSKLSGLCGGIAEYFGVKPNLIRFLVVIAALSSFGTVMLMYLIGSILVPKVPYSHY